MFITNFKKLLLLIGLFFSLSYAEINIYSFEKGEDEARFKNLITELRCPKCQNQNLADSNAPLATDLKDRTYKMINEGYSDSQIIQFMVERYGDFILYRPPVKPLTYLLWFGPLIIVIFIISLLFMHFYRLRKNTATTITNETLDNFINSDVKNMPNNSLTEEEKHKIKQLFDENTPKKL